MKSKFKTYFIFYLQSYHNFRFWMRDTEEHGAADYAEENRMLRELF